MTGHEEKEPLIGVDTNSAQDIENVYKTNESYQTRNCDAEATNNNNFDDCDTIVHMSSHRKSYGSLNGKFNLQYQQKLTYTWTGIDVFGEVPSQGSSLKNCLNRLSCCFFGGKQRDPIPRKHLLKHVAGVAAAGEILAVLGSSGAGKTTLLNALAFRSPPGVRISPTAVRALNGVPVDAMELRARCAYVQQDDLFIGSLTAREHLIFQAMLRMNRYIPYKQKVIRVEEVIQELSLIKCQHTIIGIPGRVKGLSGGERKRLAFASEALTDPPIFLCDEPTSGLDSFMAHSVLQVLKGMADKGKTVLLTIHQPSSELYELFDKILLMAEGRVAFMGTSLQASRFFSDRGAICPLNYNPADYYVQTLAIAPGNEVECRESIKKICDAFAVSKMARDIEDKANLYKRQTKDCYLAPLDGVGLRGYRATWCTQFRAILWRSWLSVLKEPLLVKVRLFQTIMVAVLIGVIFYGQQLDQDGVMNINGGIFLFLTNMTFQNVFAVINVFCAELSVFLRESRARLYRTDAYFLGKTLAEVPLFIVVPLVFTTIAYPMIGLRAGWDHFGLACLVVFLVTNVSTSFGYLISCASSSLSMALSVGPPVIIPFLLFGGFFLNSGSVPYYFTWLSYLSWFRYGNEALLINQWFDVKDGEINCNRLNSTCPGSGQIILETLNFSANNFELDFLALFGLIILFRFAAFICLMLRARSKE